MSMELKPNGICRGEGLIYAKLSVACEEPIEGLAATAATGEGLPLPCLLYDLRESARRPGQGSAVGQVEAPRDEGTRDIVVVLPLLLKGEQIITVTALLAGGGSESASIPCSMQGAKWKSRFNYRMRKDLTAEIRDIEKQDVLDRVNFWLEHAVEVDGKEEYVVHGGVWYDREGDVDLSYQIIWEDGSREPLAPIVMGTEPRPYAGDPLCLVQSELLSFRVPKGVKSFTLWATDRNDPSLQGFTTFEELRFAQFVAVGQSMRANAGADLAYHDWFMARRADWCLLGWQRTYRFAHDVLFSVVVPLYRTPVELFRAMADSVLEQSYGRWELVLVNATPGDGELAAEIAAYQAADERIRCIELPENLGIVGNTNHGIGVARGDYVCFLDHDDVIEPDALFEYARVIDEKPATGMIYCDEDKLVEGGRYVNPFFKTDFNIDLLRCHNYVCHFLCVRTSLLLEVGLSEERHNGAQDHDIALKCSERTSAIEHVAKVLYHWRVVEGSTASADQSEQNPKGYATDAGATAIREHLERLGIDAVLEPTPWAYTHHVKYLVHGEPLVSIIIPNKDCADMLDDCISSIVEKTTYGNYEIIVVENNSVEQRTFDYYDELPGRYPKARVVRWPGEFNFSKIVNFGAADATGDYFLLLNNDTEVIEPAWLENMLGVCQREEVGAVGAKLLYRDGTVQHAGVVLADVSGIAHHVYPKMPEEYSGYFLQAGLTMDYSAVTGACLLTRRSVYEELGGFDEELTVAFNDVDYCLRVRELGKLVVYEPTARLFHYESISRGYDASDAAKQARLLRESGIIYQRWSKLYFEGDPFFNPHLTSGYHKLRMG